MRLSLTDGAEEKSRVFLTLDEVKELSETEYRPQNDIKPAFMFACFTGLRYSDIYKLTWGELTVGADGTMRLDTKMKKTGKDIFIPLSDNAIAWLPERGDATQIYAKIVDENKRKAVNLISNL